MAGARDCLVWSIEHDAWWAPGRTGYVQRVGEAGRYTLAEAAEIVQHANYPPGICHECIVPVACVAPTPTMLEPALLFALQQIVAHYITLPKHSEVFVHVTSRTEVSTEDVLCWLMGWSLGARERSAEVLAEAQRQVREDGATHECSEWRGVDGRCQLCGREV